MEAKPFPTWTASDILRNIPEKFPWLWDGFLRPGALTLFSSPPRVGKSTLVSLLIDRMAQGGTLAGRAVAPGKVFVASEETAAEWAPRLRRLTLAGHTEWSLNPFPVSPTPQKWIEYVRMMQAKDASLYVIDSLQHFLPPHAENSVAGVRMALGWLRLLQRKWASVWVLHHPNKDDPAEFSFRGSTALQASVDIMMELRPLPAAALHDRRRLLHVKSRYDAPPRAVVELDAFGTGYAVRPEPPPAGGHEAGWQALRVVLEDATEPLTSARMLAEWPPDHDKPQPRTLRHWLERAVEERAVARTGDGRYRSPYRYALPGRVFEGDPFAPVPEAAVVSGEGGG